MKKTSLIFLTVVASCSVTFCAAQSDSMKNQYPADFLVETERIKSAAAKGDTLRSDSLRRDTTLVSPPPVQITYNYYYRSTFWNGWFRFWRPHRYYTLINQPGFVPRHVRGYDGVTSLKRGGFGQTGGPAVHSSHTRGRASGRSSGHSWGGVSTGHSAAS